MEVVNAIMKLKGYNMKDIERVMKAKEERKGAFNNKIFLEYVDEEKRNLEEERELKKDFRLDIKDDKINFEQLAIPYNVDKVIKEIKKLKFPFYEGILKIFYGDRN